MNDPSARFASQALLEGRLSEAETGFAALLDAEALHGLGLVRFQQNNLPAARTLLEAGFHLGPTARMAHNLSIALIRLGHVDEAIARLRWAVRTHPAYIPAWFALAEALAAAGQGAEAAAVLTEFAACAARSNDEDALTQAVARLEALAIGHPGLLRLGNLLRMAGRNALSARVLDIVLRRNPDDIAALLSSAQGHLIAVHVDEADIEARRTAYAAALADILARVKRASPAERAAAAAVVGLAHPFLLAYHGRNDRALQQLHGRIVERLTEADPWSSAPSPAPPCAGGRIRVGFASAWMHLHSVTKLFSGWIEQLDRRRFEVFGYQFSEARDATSARIERSCDRYARGIGDVGRWREVVLRDAPHALIYLDIGMEQTAPRLAARRLAPVQCVAWGHPVTSGLPTIDYFLSSALMEPPDGDDHYTEQLIRLPGLSIFYEPMPAHGGATTRASLGLPEEATVYLSCQSLFKYRPMHDTVFPRIAARVPNARFLFVAQYGLGGDAVFRDRLARAFAAYGLDWRAHCVLTAPVEPAAFPSLLRCADVFLDSLGWSGGNTTLEAIVCDLPVVTMPGDTMRGRHSAAILMAMGLDDFLCRSVDEYVGLAARLADPRARAAYVAEIGRRRHRLFRDGAPVRALEDFLTEAVARVYAADVV